MYFMIKIVYQIQESKFRFIKFHYPFLIFVIDSRFHFSLYKLKKQ